MKNNKLDSMLNKMVEFNDQKNTHFKAFLYWNNMSSEYYFKIVEILSGNMSFNDIIKVNDGDENFLIIAEKPKLMVITKNSWHYRLMKYVLKGNAPTPKDMQNGCPYFWLVIFSMITIPFILIFNVIKWTRLLVSKLIFRILKGFVISWFNGIDDEVAYDLNQYSNYTDVKIPKTVKIFLNYSDDNFFNMYLSEKYNINSIDPKYNKKEKELKGKWEIWYKNIQKRNKDLNDKRNEKNKIKIEKNIKRIKKHEESKARWDAKLKPINDSFDSIGLWFKNTFTVERGHRNMIIKRTKQFIGTIITILILIVTSFAINYIALGVMVGIDFCIEHWDIFAGIIVGFIVLFIVVAAIYGLYILVTSVGQTIINKYSEGKKIWYVEPFIYVIWYPIKYIVLLIAFIILKIFWIPIRFIFYTCIWSILSWIGIGIGKGIYNLSKTIIGSTGIFGEYFGASYSDYCPGLEWVGFDEEEEIQ